VDYPRASNTVTDPHTDQPAFAEAGPGRPVGTYVTADWLNQVTLSLMALLQATGRDPVALDTAAPATYQAVLDSIRDLIRTGSVPVGTVIQLLSATPPASYLALDGGWVDPADYGRLFDHFGAEVGDGYHFGRQGDLFRLPDSEDLFACGAGPGVPVGAERGSQNRSHTHTIGAVAPRTHGVTLSPTAVSVSA